MISNQAYLATTLKLIECQNITSSTFDNIYDKIPIEFDKTAVKLEYRGFAIDSDIPCPDNDACTFWLGVRSMKSPMGDSKYLNLSTLALQLLSIPASNADCERVFSLVRRIKTDFRSSLHTDTISSLIGVHFNSTFKCCEQRQVYLRKLSIALKRRMQAMLQRRINRFDNFFCFHYSS